MCYVNLQNAGRKVIVNNPPQKDQRKSPRIALSVPLTFRLIKKINKEKITSKLHGQSIDFSDIGICMETNNVIANGLHVLTEGMDVNNLLEVKIYLPKGSSTLTCYTRVIRYDLASENAGRRLRVYMEIKEIEPGSREKWHQLFFRQNSLKNRFSSLFNLPEYQKIDGS